MYTRIYKNNLHKVDVVLANHPYHFERGCGFSQSPNTILNVSVVLANRPTPF
jgi:hypothetical protein